MGAVWVRSNNGVDNTWNNCGDGCALAIAFVREGDNTRITFKALPDLILVDFKSSKHAELLFMVMRGENINLTRIKGLKQEWNRESKPQGR